MTPPNQDLIDEMRRTTTLCEWCGVREHLQCHHIYCKGMGGGSRLDIRENLIFLCAFCHNQFHAGHIARKWLLATVATRENSTPEAITDLIERHMWKKKGPYLAGQDTTLTNAETSGQPSKENLPSSKGKEMEQTKLTKASPSQTDTEWCNF